jgi:hypothetical protein
MRIARERLLEEVCSGLSELERDKAKIAEEAEFTTVNEHSGAVFNAVSPTRSQSIQ